MFTRFSPVSDATSRKLGKSAVPVCARATIVTTTTNKVDQTIRAVIERVNQSGRMCSCNDDVWEGAGALSLRERVREARVRVSIPSPGLRPPSPGGRGRSPHTYHRNCESQQASWLHVRK